VLRAGGARLRAAHRDRWPWRHRQRGGAVAIGRRLQLWRSRSLKPTGADLDLAVGHGRGAWLMVSGQPQKHAGQGRDMVVAVDNKERSRASPRSLTTIVDFAVGSHARPPPLLLLLP